MANEPNLTPDGGGSVSGASGPKYSGTASSADPTTEPGQYPPAAYERQQFGVSLPTNTGAPGTRGASGASDPTTEPGQTTEKISGEGPPDTTSTGAPGSRGAQNSSGGGTGVNYTLPGSYLDGTYKSASSADDFSGPQDSTQANDGGYATSGPQLPGIKGNEPEAGGSRYQPGSGSVLRGGRAVR